MLKEKKGHIEMPVSNSQLFWAMLRNRNSRSLNREFIGHTVEEKVGVVIEALAKNYAAATNDNNSIYRKEPDLAPPLFLSRLVHPFLLELLVNKDLHMNILRMVHGQQSFSFVKPIRIGDSIKVKMVVSDIRDTPAGELMEIDFDIANSESGELYGTARAGLMVRGSGAGKGTDKSGKEEKAAVEPLHRIEIKTDENQALRYADASGDHNFIHKSNFLAKLAGLPRTILHGMCALAMTTNALADKLADGDFRRLREVGVRFSAPTFPGQTITLLIFPTDDNGVIPFEVVNHKGKTILKNGNVKLG